MASVLVTQKNSFSNNSTVEMSMAQGRASQRGSLLIYFRTDIDHLEMKIRSYKIISENGPCHSKWNIHRRNSRWVKFFIWGVMWTMTYDQGHMPSPNRNRIRSWQKSTLEDGGNNITFQAPKAIREVIGARMGGWQVQYASDYIKSRLLYKSREIMKMKRAHRHLNLVSTSSPS